MTNSSSTDLQTYPTDMVKIPENFSHAWKNYAMSSTRTSPPTESNPIARLSFQTAIIQRTHLPNMRTILLKHTINFCLRKFLKQQLRKMLPNCFRTNIRPDSLWMMPIKHSSRSTGSNKTSANLQLSMCMLLRIIRTKTRPTLIPMGLLSGCNVHNNNNSANDKATTVETAPEVKTPTEATTTATDHRKIKATMCPEMVNSVFTAKSSTTHKKNAAIELMIKKPCVNGKGQLYWPKINNIYTQNAQTANSDSNSEVGSVFQFRAS